MKKVFISYSYDSFLHEKWVEELAEDLKRGGINVVFDKWDLHLGQDINTFMEISISEADRVIIVCTDKYLNRSKNLEGGVGYEKNIMSSHLFQNQKSIKFIPVIRNVKDKRKIPDFLGNRMYVDLSQNSNYLKNVNWLIDEINEVHINKNRNGNLPIKLYPARKVKEKESDPSELLKIIPGITTDGLINVDYADIYQVISGKEVYAAEILSHSCENEALVAAECLLLCFKLASIEIKQSDSCYFILSGNNSLTMSDFEEIATYLHENIGDDCDVILGLNIDDNLQNLLLQCWLGSNKSFK
ncbi:MAG: TIR domain-containing protein [Pseudomonadota bacterium]